MQPVTDATFEACVLHADRPVVLDFWAPWCAPCRKLAPVLDDLERLTPQVAFLALDVDESPVAASRYGVLSIPTVIVFADGEPHATIAGVKSREAYEKALGPLLDRQPAG